MSNLVCKNCKSIAVEYEDYVGGTSYYRCKTCGQRGDEEKFTQPTVFDTITTSPEVLAEKLVYSFACYARLGVYWRSTIIDDVDLDWSTKSEAIAATVAKLKEVCDDTK